MSQPEPLYKLVEQMRLMENAHLDNFSRLPEVQMFHALAEDCKGWAEALEAALRVLIVGIVRMLEFRAWNLTVVGVDNERT